jgi:predicted DNA-binding protein YlxM (UPF0122 family)
MSTRLDGLVDERKREGQLLEHMRGTLAGYMQERCDMPLGSGGSESDQMTRVLQNIWDENRRISVKTAHLMQISFDIDDENRHIAQQPIAQLQIAVSTADASMLAQDTSTTAVSSSVLAQATSTTDVGPSADESTQPKKRKVSKRPSDGIIWSVVGSAPKVHKVLRNLEVYLLTMEKMNKQEIAEKFNISVDSINDIMSRKSMKRCCSVFKNYLCIVRKYESGQETKQAMQTAYHMGSKTIRVLVDPITMTYIHKVAARLWLDGFK